jgi:hypothetical protein
LPNGKVLVAGGFDSNFNALTSAELYDPASGSWTATGDLNIARSQHMATLLPDGKALVAGGFDGGALTSAELYDAASGSWTATGSLNTARYLHTATLLFNGMVIVTGGLDSNIDASTSAELYDPASGSWTATGSLDTGRYWHTATLLPSGKVVVAGGFGATVNVLQSAELYDAGQVARVNGRGSIDGQGDQATFNFHATHSGDNDSGSFSYGDPAAGVSIAKAKIRRLTINGNSADFSGTVNLGEGNRVRFSVSVTDNSDTGSPDSLTISLSNGYSAGSNLTSGDIRVR